MYSVFNVFIHGHYFTQAQHASLANGKMLLAVKGSVKQKRLVCNYCLALLVPYQYLKICLILVNLAAG